MDQLSKNSDKISSCQQQLVYTRYNNILHEKETESTSATQKHHKTKKVVTTKDNNVNVPINTSFANFDIESPESDKTTTSITNSSSKEKQISKAKKENKVKKVLMQTSKKQLLY